MKSLGYLCFWFAIIDFSGMFFGYDLTGVSWSPIVAGAIGSWLVEQDDSDEEIVIK